jgi:two-component system, cell cycle sensor histidine kinase and response regulator CckA
MIRMPRFASIAGRNYEKARSGTIRTITPYGADTHPPGQRPLEMKKPAVTIVTIYLVLGAVWILFSDHLLNMMVHDTVVMGRAQTLKGWFYIGVTGWLLYVLINRGVRRIAFSTRAFSDSEHRFSAFFNGATAGIAMVNTRGEYLDINPSWAKMLGYDRKALMAMNDMAVTHPDDLGLYREKMAALVGGGIGHYRHEKRLLCRDGGMVWVDLSVASHRNRDGDIEFIQMMAIDISKRKAAEAALQESQALFDSFMRHMPALAFMKNADGRYLFVNESYRRIYGLDPAQRIGKTDDELWPAHVARVLKKNDQRVWSTGEVVNTTEILDFGDERKAARVSKFPLIKDGKPHILGGISFDITDQFKAEEEKEKLESQLLKAQKMEALGTLAGGIAHDFNNLLMGILGNASLMRMDLDPSHPHSEKLKQIEAYVQSGSELTRQLLGFAQSGKYEVRPTDITDLIRRSSNLFGRTKKEIHIHAELLPETWAVAVDQGQIEQVMINFYVNASQAMPAGGDLYLKTENRVLDASGGRLLNLPAGRYVRIVVADTGIGMDEDVRRRIFDPFFTTRKMGHGAGMGMASAYGIIKNHRGTIDVVSKTGEGTRFSIYLPASDRPAVKSDADPGSAAGKGPASIYLVDDEPMILEVGRAMLERLGYRVRTFDSGPSVIQALEAEASGADLVILDMIMPDMGGGEVYERIRGIGAPVRILLSSGYSVDGQAQGILDRGCDGFIQKPFNMASLSKKIGEVLKGWA